MHKTLNRYLTSIALVLSIITLTGALYGAVTAWMALQEVQQGLTELGSLVGGTETPAPVEVPSSECYTEPGFGETICEPAIPE